MMKKPSKVTIKPGVYLFANAEGVIVYIGKAKNIAKRIASYFNNPFDFKNRWILSEASSLQTIPTASEQEALYLEADLIKKYQPKYNQLLKDGNPFVYLYFSQDTVPTITVERVKEKRKKGLYVGPFLTKSIARIMLNFLIQTFQLKVCNKNMEHGCLQYHIGICAGFCRKDFDLKYYKFRFKLAQYLITKDPDQAIELLDKKIAAASSLLQFEKAKTLFDYKKNFQLFVQTVQNIATMPSRRKAIDLSCNLPLLQELKDRLRLKHIPYVIDCFDISHMQGKAIVGACIRYVNALPEPASFRRFKIKSLIDQNDYAALAEMVSRRYKSKDNYPNLVIVDGGKGQISAIRALVGSSELVGLAKKEETVLAADFSTLLKLNVKNKADALVLQIRDKTHDFAVSYHRKKMKVE